MKNYEKIIKNKLLELIEEKKQYDVKLTSIQQNKKANIRNIAIYLLSVSDELITKNKISIVEHKILLLNEIILDVEIMEIDNKIKEIK